MLQHSVHASAVQRHLRAELRCQFQFRGKIHIPLRTVVAERFTSREKTINVVAWNTGIFHAAKCGGNRQIHWREGLVRRTIGVPVPHNRRLTGKMCHRSHRNSYLLPPARRAERNAATRVCTAATATHFARKVFNRDAHQACYFRRLQNMTDPQPAGTKFRSGMPFLPSTASARTAMPTSTRFSPGTISPNR